MMDTAKLADLFRALSDETRVRMFAMLVWAEELCVCDFVNLLQITQSKASRHLRYMKSAGLLTDNRDGVWMRYRISDALNEEQEQILKSVKTVFESERYRFERERLDEYLKRKASSNSQSCRL